MTAILRDCAGRVPAIILHSFSEGSKVFESGLAAGAYFSFSGMITFGNWRPRFPLGEVPRDRMLIETDAPYLAPVPHRGYRNEPAFVREVAQGLARCRGTTLEEIAGQTTANARRVLGLRLETTLATGEGTA